MRVLSYLIAGVLVYGGLGWLGDHYLGTGFLLPIGIVLGAAGGCYVIIRRYGQVPGSSAGKAFQQPHPVGPATFDDKATRDQKATVDKRATVDKNTEGAR
ncbi:MAG: AtpZ/AtpI family protein [Propionibacteriaceae bacterium]|nr:AtpZ/AtpI family protein [Propionibacteriaceae bacterium]